MPTPSEVTTLPSPPAEASSSRASFTSCPPEEERDHNAPRESRIDSPLPTGAETEAEAAESEHTTIQQQQPTPEPEARLGAPESVVESRAYHEKGEHIEDAGIATEAPSTAASSGDAPAESEARPAHSSSDATSPSTEPLYMRFPNERTRLPPHSTSSFLQPGSKFRGTQQSDRQIYDVQVEIKDINMPASSLSGYLRIQGLTDDHPTLTTFFEGEIIGPKHLFKTTHASWGSSEKVDLQHWARFPAWRPLAKSAAAAAAAANKNPTPSSTSSSSSSSSSNFTLKNYQQREHLFMRWKEYFLVPDHRVKTITGASFEGFYYICFNQCSGSVSGIYYHAKSEKYQQLELEHVGDGGCVGAVEFR
ncbi:hypothetical protein LTR91_007866 [Friedmanniomyces endolithicus]|uniref:Vesicle-mediated transport protein Vid24 n=1 Tax=Friedmanniomyces endolithicus TaxID=329885 RepID=A0AAN6KNZ5_9PEZI|nr:hypothetical protein LTS09_012524 [Friedmanniomyces endolithicus]KAK0273851.1 hypothetical protein LTR35_011977 [Friedmanniomyces endolithicus]KAK0279887.1 hypothetical protein LTS00_013267 [Friedmanniomyces endolithicus]KAK0311007.1 hypothetical protein LTR82_014456 [Friedmanniomyces endolithicus]KAK0926138.1 hypothetical protein LTR57_004389 [Friedmanniomyces endolithicus]